MPNIVLSDKSFLREHPDDSPINDPSLSLTHSFVFPGDEIVFYSGITLPYDAGSNTMGNIELKNVTLKIIAQKPDIFSIEFSQEFQATREFILDSFSLPLNNSNAPVTMWGSDGYAPNLNFNQDRNWKLPSGDFRRQIKFYTTHPASIPMTPGNDPPSLIWYPSGMAAHIAIALTGDTNAIGLVDWDTDLNTTMIKLANSINTNTNFGTFFSIYTSFGSTAGYTAVWSSLSQTLTLNPPFGIKSGINGVDFIMANSSGLSFYSGTYFNTWSGGTDDIPETNKFIYNFNFPVLFRWEYWKLLAAADNDFFNLSQSQNGKNNFWHHYQTAAWNIKYRLEFDVKVAGVATRLTSEISSNNPSILSNDYASNTDYTSKSIKTCEVGGTPSNTPVKIFSYQNTSCFAYFTKVSAWDDIYEKWNFRAVFWIEPFEGGGVPVRLRGSSWWPLTPETCFTGLSQPIIDGDGNLIDDGSGGILVTDEDGYPVHITIDPTDDKKLIVSAQIDYVKLTTSYPGIKKFTLYCRLYNITDSGMGTPAYRKMGEEIKADAILINNNVIPNIDIPITTALDCPFNLEVFADPSNPIDEFKNDKSDFYYYADMNNVTAITIVLQKNTSVCGTGTYEDKATITDNTYGLFFSYGKAPDFSGTVFIDDYDKKYTGIFLDWLKVYNDFGSGKYRMKVTYAASTPYTNYSNSDYCLALYNSAKADGTVKIETINMGLRGTMDDRKLQIDYYTGWQGQIRLRGLFWYKNSSYTKEYNQYGEDEFNEMRPIINEQIPKYGLKIKPVPGWIDWYLSTVVLQADNIFITDYNSCNRHKYMQVPVINEGDIQPNDEVLVNQLAIVEMSFIYGQNNLRKRND